MGQGRYIIQKFLSALGYIADIILAEEIDNLKLFSMTGNKPASNTLNELLSFIFIT